MAEQEEFLDELHQIVREEKADVILIAGDAFDTVNPPAAAEQLFYESLARLADYGKRKVVVIAGNHDHPDRLAAAAPLAEQHGITLLGYPELVPYSFDIPSCQQRLNVAALAYPSESRLKELLTENQTEESLQLKYDQKIAQLFAQMTKDFHSQEVNIAMSHLFIAGGDPSDSERPIQVGGAYTVAPQSLPANVQYVALGHLHRPQTIHKARTLARYSGSPLAYSFSESGYTKSVTMLEINPGEAVEMKEIYLASGKPLVKWKATEGINQIYQWVEEGRDPNAWIDVEVHVQHALTMEQIHQLRKIHPGFIQIKPVFQDTSSPIEQVSVSTIPIDDIFRRFYEKQSGGAEAEEELVRIFLECLREEEDEMNEGIAEEVSQ